MNIEIKEQNGSFIGRLYGWIDTAIATQFLEDMKPLMVHADKSIELNCAQLEYICSLGLRGLLQLKKESESKGGTLTAKSASRISRKNSRRYNCPTRTRTSSIRGCWRCMPTP